VAPDNRIGRFITDSVASMPKLSPAAFDKLLNDKIQVKICVQSVPCLV
jgi:translation initiation factor 3 subunit F